jgi:hypothetical protein
LGEVEGTTLGTVRGHTKLDARDEGDPERLHMTSAIDLTGQKFGRLTAVRKEPRSRRDYWLWSCECGVLTVAEPVNVKTGRIKSCGCLRREQAKARQGALRVKKAGA